MKKLTVKELIEILNECDPEATIWIDNHGEHRALSEGDVQRCSGEVYDCDEGDIVDLDEFVEISSWS